MWRSASEDVRSDLWMTGAFSDTPLQSREFERTQQVASTTNPLPSLCFWTNCWKRWAYWPQIWWVISTSLLLTLKCLRSDRKMKMISLWLVKTFFFLILCNHWKEFDETWHEGRTRCPLPSFVVVFFSGRSINKNRTRYSGARYKAISSLV